MTDIAPLSVWLLVQKQYNLRNEAMPRYQVVRSDKIDYCTARTLKLNSNYKILFNKSTSMSVKTLVHELAHIVAWERPDLGAKGHNTEFMHILYTLEEVMRKLDYGSLESKLAL